MSYVIMIVAILVLFGAVLLFAPKGWRTMIWTTLGMVAAPIPEILSQLFGTLQGFDWTLVLDKAHAAVAALIFLIGSQVLRVYTTTPIGQKTTTTP